MQQQLGVTPNVLNGQPGLLWTHNEPGFGKIPGNTNSSLGP